MMKHLASAITTFVAGTLFWVALSAQAPTGATVFEGARVIVGDGSAPLENAVFVV